MVRGTTPTLTFNFPFSIENMEIMYITIVQGNKKLEKNLSDISVADNIAKVTLTQADTLAFQPNGNAEIQVRCKTFSGTALASQIIRVPVERILKDGEI